jgi:hypothetical protein
MFTEFRASLDFEMNRVYVREDVVEVAASTKLQGRVNMRVNAYFVDTRLVPFEQLIKEDQLIYSHRHSEEAAPQDTSLSKRKDQSKDSMASAVSKAFLQKAAIRVKHMNEGKADRSLVSRFH